MARVSGLLCVLLAPALAHPASAAPDLTSLSLETLLATRVTSASKYEQSLLDVPAAVVVITRADIQAYGWRTLAEALASLPGMSSTYDRQYSYLGIRGFGQPGDFDTRMLVAINGNRANDVVYDSAMTGRELPLEMDMVERIEVLTGPGGAVYGQNAMFGVVNVITRNGQQLDGGELATSWQNPQAVAEARVRWGKVLANGVDVVLSLSAMNARGRDLFMVYPGAGPGGTTISGVASDMDGERDREFFGRISRGAWALDLGYGSRLKDDPTAVYFADPLVPGQYERDDFLLSQLQYQDTRADGTLNMLGRLFLGRARYLGHFSYAGAANVSRGFSDWYGGELRFLYTGIERHKLMLGVELQDNARVDQSNNDLSVPGVGLNALRAPGSGLETEILRSGYRAGVYVQDEWQLDERWSTSVGLRLDRNDVTGTSLSPRAALIWRASSTTTFKTLYGRAHRAPNTYERDYDDAVSLIANPELRGESADTLELLIDHQLASNISTRASLYHWRIEDMITLGLEPRSGLPQYRSGEDAKASGLELSATSAWNDGAQLRTSVSWQDASYHSGIRLANSPRWLARANYSRPLPRAGLRLGFELRYDGARNANDGTELDAYWLSNVNLSADSWLPGLEVSLTLLNVFDQDYEHPAADSNWQNTLGQDGRGIRVRLDYRF
jgi:iron complex outermembrane receptor protein